MVLHKQVMGSQEVGYTNDQLLGLFYAVTEGKSRVQN